MMAQSKVAFTRGSNFDYCEKVLGANLGLSSAEKKCSRSVKTFCYLELSCT